MRICWMNCAVIPKTPQLARVKSFWFWWNLLWISLFFHEGQSKPSSRVCGYIMNDQNALMPHIFWKPWMYPTMISGLSFNILMLKIWPISTAWITVHSILHYDPESRIRGIRRKNQNDNMDKNTYKYCWGHPGLSGNVWH